MKTVIIIFIVIQLALVYTVYINGKKFYEERNKNTNIKYKIYDIGHKYLPNLSKIKNIEEITNLFLFFPFILEPQIITDFFSYILPIYMFRLLTTNATILPKASNCDDSTFGFFNFINGHCYDKLFSGHMATTSIITSLMYRKNYDAKFLFLYNLIISFLLVSSRQHYTADVLFGGYIGYTAFCLDINAKTILKKN